jgi:hypothetical protein
LPACASCRLDPAVNEYTVVFGPHAENDREIVMLTRSIMEVLIDLASHIDLPQADAEEGRVYGPSRTDEQQRLFSPTAAGAQRHRTSTRSVCGGALSRSMVLDRRSRSAIKGDVHLGTLSTVAH